MTTDVPGGSEIPVYWKEMNLRSQTKTNTVCGRRVTSLKRLGIPGRQNADQWCAECCHLVALELQLMYKNGWWFGNMFDIYKEMFELCAEEAGWQLKTRPRPSRPDTKVQ